MDLAKSVSLNRVLWVCGIIDIFVAVAGGWHGFYYIGGAIIVIALLPPAYVY